MIRRPVIGSKISNGTSIPISSVKASIVFRPGTLPRVDPSNRTFVLTLGEFLIDVTINAKAARKLATHSGGAVLQGRLVCENGRLRLLEGGFSWFDQPAAPAETHGGEK
jgi:hypothetical protein